MNILITGSGFIGSALAKYFAQNHSVTVISKSYVKYDDNINFIKSDLTYETDAIQDQIKNQDVVIHTAAVTGSNRIHNVDASIENIAIDLNVMNALRKLDKKIKVIYFSSSAVYGNTKNAKETNDLKIPDKSNGLYASEKIFGEQIFQSLNHDVIIVRPFNVIGSEQKKEHGFVIPNIIYNIKNSKKLKVNFDARRSYIDILDLVVAIDKIIKNGKEKVYNIANPNNYISTPDLVNLIQKLLNQDNVQIEYFNDNTGIIDIKPNINRLKKIFKPCLTLDYALKKIICSLN